MLSKTGLEDFLLLFAAEPFLAISEPALQTTTALLLLSGSMLALGQVCVNKQTRPITFALNRECDERLILMKAFRLRCFEESWRGV